MTHWICSGSPPEAWPLPLWWPHSPILLCLSHAKRWAPCKAAPRAWGSSPHVGFSCTRRPVPLGPGPSCIAHPLLPLQTAGRSRCLQPRPQHITPPNIHCSVTAVTPAPLSVAHLPRPCAPTARARQASITDPAPSPAPTPFSSSPGAKATLKTGVWSCHSSAVQLSHVPHTPRPAHRPPATLAP